MFQRGGGGLIPFMFQLNKGKNRTREIVSSFNKQSQKKNNTPSDFNHIATFSVHHFVAGASLLIWQFSKKNC